MIVPNMVLPCPACDGTGFDAQRVAKELGTDEIKTHGFPCILCRGTKQVELVACSICKYREDYPYHSSVPAGPCNVCLTDEGEIGFILRAKKP